MIVVLMRTYVFDKPQTKNMIRQTHYTPSVSSFTIGMS